jgi:DNA-directed RNA polymerase subunit RPC12/RpoP
MAQARTAVYTCDRCGEEVDGVWSAPEEDEEQDQDEAPVAVQVCPGCGYAQSVEYPGWSVWTEAG